MAANANRVHSGLIANLGDSGEDRRYPCLHPRQPFRPVGVIREKCKAESQCSMRRWRKLESAPQAGIGGKGKLGAETQALQAQLAVLERIREA